MGESLNGFIVIFYQSYAPPEEIWVIDETVHYFGVETRGEPDPLPRHGSIVPDNGTMESGAHWHREPP